MSGKEWREEVVSKGDLGSYGTQQQELKRADYIRGFKGGDFVREKIRKRCEWGRHWQKGFFVFCLWQFSGL